MECLEFKDSKQVHKNVPAYFFDDVITFDHIYNSITECYKVTPWKRSSQLGFKNIVLNTQKLYEALCDETYMPKEPRKFIISERGKTRNIDSFAFLDKVIQKVLAQNVLLKIIDKSCIYDTYACLKGRGITKAGDRLSTFLVSCKNKYKEFGVAKIDIKSYFESINTEIMLSLIKDLVDDKLFRLFKRLYKDDNLSLGSELNQLFATLYLNKIDHKIKEIYKIKYYVRYQDDFVLLDENIEYLKFVVANLERDFKDIKLKINQKKTKVCKFKRVEFLKIQYTFKNGKLCKRKTNNSTKFLIRKIRKLKKLNLDKQYLLNYEKSILGQFTHLNNLPKIANELHKLVYQN